MYCPRCAQQQVSEDVKFCSKCGFQLELVAEILANGGTLPQLADLHQSNGIMTRRNGLIFGGLWMFFFVLLITPLLGIITEGGDLPGVTAIIGIFGGLFIMLLSVLLLKSEVKKRYSPVLGAPNSLDSAVLKGELPSPQSIPANDYVAPKMGTSSDTGELVPPSSVTDSTTKLLHRDE